MGLMGERNDVLDKIYREFKRSSAPVGILEGGPELAHDLVPCGAITLPCDQGRNVGGRGLKKIRPLEGYVTSEFFGLFQFYVFEKKNKPPPNSSRFYSFFWINKNELSRINIFRFLAFVGEKSIDHSIKSDKYNHQDSDICGFPGSLQTREVPAKHVNVNIQKAETEIKNKETKLRTWIGSVEKPETTHLNCALENSGGEKYKKKLNN